MSRMIVSSFVVLIASLSLLSCYKVGSSTMINETTNGRTVELGVGQNLDVALDENPTTGFRWEIESMDKALLVQSSEPEFKQDSDALGAGGKKTFHFKALSSGRTNLKLILHRSWEKDVPPVRIFEVTIIVK